MARGPTTGVFTRAGRASQGPARFASQVDAWVQQTQKRMNAVFRLSTQKLITIAQTTVPYQDGFLRASMVVLVNKDPPPATRSEDQGMGPYNDAYMQVAIAGAKAGDRILAAYTMEYARRLEYGFVGADALGRQYNQAPVGWVRRAAAQWQAVVAESVAEAKARSPSGGR